MPPAPSRDRRRKPPMRVPSGALCADVGARHAVPKPRSRREPGAACRAAPRAARAAIGLIPCADARLGPHLTVSRGARGVPTRLRPRSLPRNGQTHLGTPESIGRRSAARWVPGREHRGDAFGEPGGICCRAWAPPTTGPALEVAEQRDGGLRRGHLPNTLGQRLRARQSRVVTVLVGISIASAISRDLRFSQ